MNQTEALPEQIEAIIRASESGDDEMLCDDRTEISFAIVEALKKKVDQAIRADVRQALRLAELTHRVSLRCADPLAQALGLRARAQALHITNRYDEALELYRQAEAIYQTLDRPVEAARLKRAMIDALMYLSRYDEALQLADEARQILETHHESLLLAQLETNVGNIHHRQDQYHQALRCYERASRFFESVGDLTAQAVVSYNSGNIQASLDEFRQAQTLYEKALALYRAQNMELSAAHVEYSLGYLHFLRGEYHQALRVLHAAETEFARLSDERHAALCQLDLAEIYLQLHILDEAERYAGLARANFQRLGVRYEAARALAFLGLALLHQSRFAAAEQTLRAAAQEFNDEGNEVFTALCHLYLAELMLRREQPEAAEALALTAQQSFARQQLKTKTWSAQLVTARARLLMDEPEEARELIAETLEESRAVEAPWLRYQAQELFGDVLLAEGATQAAQAQYAEAINCIERIRASIRVDEFRSAFFRDKLRVYEKLIRLCLERGEPQSDAEAFFYLESRKARTLVDQLLNELSVTPDEQSHELIEQWRQLREELHWYYSRISQHEGNGQSRRLATDAKLQEEIRTREVALAELARQTQLRDSRFVWLRNVSGLRVEELQAALKADETVIEYYFDGEALKIFVIDRDSLRVTDRPGARSEIRNLILELRFQLDKFRYSQAYLDAHLKRLRASTNAVLERLWQLLFAPVAAQTAGRKLVFIPFDLLHNVPFAALFDGQSYLLEQHEISIAPSARLFVHSAGQIVPHRESALILGAADELAPRITEEIRAIHELFPESRCLTGPEATAQALTEHLPASDFVHIACHAVFRQDNPMFSAFRLSDRWLNFFDISALRMRPALVTLSGCSTGANLVYAGDELLGLVRGFLYAGAASLVVSLWAVNDQATANLMTAFYERLRAGAPPRSALRQAALKIKTEYEHPYYWSPFVFIGCA